MRSTRGSSGDISVLHASRANLLLNVDLVHGPTGTVIQVDGPEHFTSFRLQTLDLYPAGVALGFDLDEHRELCRACCATSDAIARGMPAKGFGFGGVPRERAYHDALFDLATPAMGHPPLRRVAALDGDGAAAYQRHRAALLALSFLSVRGSIDSSVTATLTVRQRPQRTRTFFVM